MSTHNISPHLLEVLQLLEVLIGPPAKPLSTLQTRKATATVLRSKAKDEIAPSSGKNSGNVTHVNIGIHLPVNDFYGIAMWGGNLLKDGRPASLTAFSNQQKTKIVTLPEKSPSMALAMSVKNFFQVDWSGRAMESPGRRTAHTSEKVDTLMKAGATSAMTSDDFFSSFAFD